MRIKENNEKKYSVIIPVYNAEKFLTECLESVLKIERDDIEVIAVDDGSKDHSLMILKNWEKKDYRIRVLTQANSGVSVARNKGIEMAQGEWILFLDADDFFLQDPFAEFDRLISRYSECDWFVYDSIEEREIRIKDKKEELMLATLGVSKRVDEFDQLKCLSTVWGKLYHRNLLLNGSVKFDKDLVMGEDLIFNLYVELLIDKLVTFHKSFYYYRPNFDSASKSYNPNVPKRDLFFQNKLRIFCDRYQLQLVKEVGCKMTAIGGILLSCNSCFHRYPFSKYKESKKEFEAFVRQDVYQEALRRSHRFNGYNLLQKSILIGAQKGVYFPGYVLRKIYSYIKKVN